MTDPQKREMDLTGPIREKIEKIEMVYRVLILVGTVVLLGVLFIWLVYIPETEEIAQISDQNTALKQKISEVEAKTKNLARFEADQDPGFCHG